MFAPDPLLAPILAVNPKRLGAEPDLITDLLAAEHCNDLEGVIVWNIWRVRAWVATIRVVGPPPFEVPPDIRKLVGRALADEDYTRGGITDQFCAHCRVYGKRPSRKNLKKWARDTFEETIKPCTNHETLVAENTRTMMMLDTEGTVQ